MATMLDPPDSPSSCIPSDAAPINSWPFPPPDYYLSEEDVAGCRASPIDVQPPFLDEGEKIDFWILTDEPFDRYSFCPKRSRKVPGPATANVSSPEDTILVKLRWAKLSGGSEKQFTDALRVYEIQGDKLDLHYLNHWATQLGVEDLWQRIQAGSGTCLKAGFVARNKLRPVRCPSFTEAPHANSRHTSPPSPRRCRPTRTSTCRV